jgi:hypothetical protein
MIAARDFLSKSTEDFEQTIMSLKTLNTIYVATTTGVHQKP